MAQFNTLEHDEAVQRIAETVASAGPGEAPFALVLGSGFSYPLVPLVKAIVEEELPLWMQARATRTDLAELKGKPVEERVAVAKAYWKSFVERHPEGEDGEPVVKLNHRGLPANPADAYTAAFDVRYGAGLATPARAREFQRHLVRPHEPRLNSAHFFLASILGAQPSGRRRSETYRHEAAFSRLIFTTNFDPFMQTALQMVNRLYVLNDTPTLGLHAEEFDDDSGAIHLVYAHGSVHRRAQAADKAQIEALRDRNAADIAPLLDRRGVIVLGYSGWDDVLLAALQRQNRFEHNLYWFDLKEAPTPQQGFGAGVGEVLARDSAFYVRTPSAGVTMAGLAGQLIGMPQLLEDPIGQLSNTLACVDLSELDEPLVGAGCGGASSAVAGVGDAPLRDALVHTRARLAEAARAYWTAARGGSESAGDGEDALPFGAELERADLHRIMGRLPDAIRGYELVIGDSDDSRVIARALVGRALVWDALGDHKREIEDYDRVIALSGAPERQVARARLNRGVQRARDGDVAGAIVDFSEVFESGGATAGQRAKALFGRALARSSQGDHQSEFDDYTRIIEMRDAPAEQVSRALFNRGCVRSDRGDKREAAEDYAAVVGLIGVPLEQVARAQFNLGCLRAQEGDAAAAIYHLRAWRDADLRPTREVLDRDVDLDAIRDDEDFRSFRESVPE